MKPPILLLLLMIFQAGQGFCQENIPLYFTNLQSEEIPVYELSPAMLKANTEIQVPEDKIYQVGIPVPVTLELKRYGRWFYQPNGTSACILRIRSEKASHLNLILSGMGIDSKSSLFAYAPGGSNLHQIDVLDNKMGASIPIEGEELILEYNGRAGNIPEITIDYIVHGINNFWNALRDFKESGPCNINVNCPEGSAWTAQASAVVMLLTSHNSRFCTGTLINNTSGDGTPYILTAAHCDPAITDLFMFNYQSPGCANQDGPVNQIIQGCNLRAKNSGSDFCLVELNKPPQDFQTYLCGWDYSGNVPINSTVIHHPEGDIKKITFDTDPPETSPYLGAICWHILGYDAGTTESGSSGAPLFNEQKHIVGQLYGGFADCNFNFDDYYGKFSASWKGNSTTERLSDWLDPKRKQQNKLDGIPFQFARMEFDARLVQIRNLPDVICGDNEVLPELEIKNMGTSTLQSIEIQYQYNDDSPITLVVNGPLLPLASVEVVIPSPVGIGEQVLKCWINSLQPGPDERVSNDSLLKVFNLKEGYPFTFSIITDTKSTETSFRFLNSQEEVFYEQASATLGDEAEFNFQFCLPAGCYTLEINDQGGDGICCASGNGAYYLKDPFNQIVFSGGQFANQKQEFFCFDSTLSIQSLKNQVAMDIFPVPSKGMVKITFRNTIGKKSIRILDLTGRTVLTTSTSDNQVLVDLSRFGQGMYFVESISGSDLRSGRILIEY